MDPDTDPEVTAPTSFKAWIIPTGKGKAGGGRAYLEELQACEMKIAKASKRSFFY